jgi:hypothetical protein
VRSPLSPWGRTAKTSDPFHRARRRTCGPRLHRARRWRQGGPGAEAPGSGQGAPWIPGAAPGGHMSGGLGGRPENHKNTLRTFVSSPPGVWLFWVHAVRVSGCLGSCRTGVWLFGFMQNGCLAVWVHAERGPRMSRRWQSTVPRRGSTAGGAVMLSRPSVLAGGRDGG